MSTFNKKMFLKFKIQKAPDFKNPFLYYYPGCGKNLLEKINSVCPICYKFYMMILFSLILVLTVSALLAYLNGINTIQPVLYAENLS